MLQIETTTASEQGPAFSIHGLHSEIPVVAVSLHAAHHVRPEVARVLRLPADERLREEDVGMDVLATTFEARILAHRSRFELDLNRPPARAVYCGPGDAWGLEPWKAEPSPELMARSLRLYVAFHRAVRSALQTFARRHPRFVLLDLHSYNHRRAGAAGAATAPAMAPQINVGTGSMDRRYWAPVVEALTERLAAGVPATGPLDVRENVNFRGGHFPAWVHQNFPHVACAPAIEIKKTYMDEWTGQVAPDRLAGFAQALAAAVPPLCDALGSLK